MKTHSMHQDAPSLSRNQKTTELDVKSAEDADPTTDATNTSLLKKSS